jgi:hypothetical protein
MAAIWTTTVARCLRLHRRVNTRKGESYNSLEKVRRAGPPFSVREKNGLAHP